MPYDLRFSKAFKTEDKGQYLNECCVGGDIVLAEIQKAPFVSLQANEKVSHGQEDWGWYLWFWRGNAKFEISICLDEDDNQEFRIHIIRQIKAGLFSKKMEDNEELKTIQNEVKVQIESWTGKTCISQKIELE